MPATFRFSVKVPKTITHGLRLLSYYRLHGSPKMYYSAYSEEDLDTLAGRLREDTAGGRTVWCIFDNTTLGAATRNALDLRSRLAPVQKPSSSR